MNLYEQQALNRRRTWMVMAAFIVLLLIVGAGFDLCVIGAGQSFVPPGTMVALATGGGQPWWTLRFGGGRGRKGKGGGAIMLLFLVVWVVAVILAPLLAQLLAMAVSRKRESLADASGAELTRNPMGLASALEKIDAAVAPTAAIKR